MPEPRSQVPGALKYRKRRVMRKLRNIRANRSVRKMRTECAPLGVFTSIAWTCEGWLVPKIAKDGTCRTHMFIDALFMFSQPKNVDVLSPQALLQHWGVLTVSIIISGAWSKCPNCLAAFSCKSLRITMVLVTCLYAFWLPKLLRCGTFSVEFSRAMVLVTCPLALTAQACTRRLSYLCSAAFSLRILA